MLLHYSPMNSIAFSDVLKIIHSHEMLQIFSTTLSIEKYFMDRYNKHLVYKIVWIFANPLEFRTMIENQASFCYCRYPRFDRLGS